MTDRDENRVPMVRVQGGKSVPGVTHTHVASWVSAALAQTDSVADGVITVRFVEDDESEDLNNRFRGQDGPTNVLSFPADRSPHDPLIEEEVEIGDIVVCVPQVRREARDQGKPLHSHIAHMIVHGTLHLLGFDHGDDQQAADMEALESCALARFGIADPYLVAEVGETP